MSMTGRKRTATRRSGRQNAASTGDGEPDVYQEMLEQAGVSAPDKSSPERPLKRRRPGFEEWEKAGEKSQPEVSQSGQPEEEEMDEEEDAEFDDVVLPIPTAQTMELESDDEDDEDEEFDLLFQDITFESPLKEASSVPQKAQSLELNLSTASTSMSPSKRPAERRKPITKEERERRLDIHKMHLLCLLSHVARRNHWCNDAKAQEYLRPHLTDKTVGYLNPGTNLSQFGRTESLKKGLQLVADVWKSKFEITERGMKRALWAEEVEQLQDYELPKDMESCLDKEDFRDAAKRLQGSRDIGAQLYCALLRSAGVKARLVCSLQPLSFLSGGPLLPKPLTKKTPSAAAKNEEVRATLAKYEKMAEAPYSSSGSLTSRRRLGHPNAAAYNFEPTASPPKKKPVFHTPTRIRESTYPVYWVEILDVGHQKWQPSDPVVMHTVWKPGKFEPAITDKENCMSYVVAFEADGTAKDVTKRYAKAYTAKTRKLRVEIAHDGGDKWWRKTMKPFRRKWPTDLDQIEDNELIGIESREPMPRNVQDFKGHPVYALERHLRRNEVLVPGCTPSGTVAAGSRAPLEKIYRRKDVRVARTADKWYRMGRELKPFEIPVKWLPKKPKVSRFGEEEEDDQGPAGTPLFTQQQTELYEPAPVRNGRVTKNKFGNIDVYVPSMVPKGGVHIINEHARRAAYTLGVDYAPALTGFSFKGRHGTAVLSGIVVAEEYQEAIHAIIDGLNDVEAEIEEERKRLAALKMWRRFIMGLRIRERIWSGVGEEERQAADREAAMEAEIEEAESDVTEEFDMGDDEDMAGGFMVD